MSVNNMKDDLFWNAPTALLFIDPFNDVILAANQQASALFAMKQADIINGKVTEFFAGCLGELFAFTQQVLQEGHAWSSELFIMSNGDNVYLDMTARRHDNKLILSCQQASLAFAHHFKALAQSEYKAGIQNWNTTVFEEIERQNQLLLSAVGDGIYGVDLNGNTTFVNRAAEQILGWKKAELAGKNMHNLIHHSHHDGTHYHPHACPIYSAFKDGSVHSVDNEVFWKKDGTAVPVEYTSTPVTENGVLIGAVVVFRDITQRKSIQTKLLNALQEVDSLKQRLEMEKAYLLEEINADFNHHRIIGQSMKVKHMINQIELVAATNANVLITGESGTGKELIARAIHEESERKARPLIRVNCAAIPADLFESEFFGHVKGAFSGAISDRVGRFELADGATIFLDEVGEIPLPLQGKLLRVLQEQQFERVGESKTRHVDVRVISATNQHLKKLVEENKFREDLYFRLNVFPIHSPALRERADDIPLLVKYFIDKICLNVNRPHPELSVAQMNFLKEYHWPGNIRELENIIERQIILAKSNKIDFEFLVNETVYHSQPLAPAPMPKLMSVQDQKTLERTNLINALQHCQGKIYGADGAAELLGLKPTTLSSKLKKYGIHRQDFAP
jgi:PAS domain S-box-containing protein